MDGRAEHSGKPATLPCLLFVRVVERSQLKARVNIFFSTSVFWDLDASAANFAPCKRERKPLKCRPKLRYV
jgi:hypothetical protein